jgi:hypothetical protein
MSNRGKKPDISKIKQRISGRDIGEEEEEAQGAPQEVERPKMKPETMEQVHRYARDVEKLRAEEVEEEQEAEKTELEELPEELKERSAMHANTFYRQTNSDNPEVREAIEDNCSEMDFADLIITGRVSQFVPIIKDKFEVEFQSLLAIENFWIERQAEKEGTTDWALRSWMGYARLALSLTTINGRELPAFASKEGDGGIDQDVFQSRFDQVMSMGEKPVEYLLVNLNWFNDRVDRLAEHDFEQLKNG